MYYFVNLTSTCSLIPTTRIAKQWSAVHAQRQSSQDPAIKLTPQFFLIFFLKHLIRCPLKCFEEGENTFFRLQERGEFLPRDMKNGERCIAAFSFVLAGK